MNEGVDHAYSMTLDDTPNPSKACHACARPFKDAPQTMTGAPSEGMSPLGRYRCPDCQNDFCAECDVFVHDVVHYFPGCCK